ncbi:DUF3097 domain-containing protein [Sinosporangium siamense]|uniref:DUF3097 domain-containing protein n=1 Tax=Sinosporangium siamense TaxID=1367973 RepID=A0A919RBY6_9ACTN|nr:DUF3097 domain-containing protein [Sinosporangium siamense]GII89960.1 hypothetical protein Ssi02_01910 [Sinosporangium siamense]
MYGRDVLSDDWRRPKKRVIPTVTADHGLVVEDVAGEFCGAVVGCDKEAVTLEDRFGRRRLFPLVPAGFLLEGEVVTLVRPPAGPAAPRRSASGSIAVEGLRARVARESRIYVEGVHDAALVEKIWGHDLRVEGVVVEYLAGVDDLPDVVAEFAPGPGRRLGVLVDHLVPGSKESRIAEKVASSPDVLIVGHPFVDIWEAVKPAVLRIPTWPQVPKGVPWKEGVIQALGWGIEPADAWHRILGSVSTYADLEPALLGRVEELIDFVTSPDAER